jgi:hypothetical protein
MTRLAGDLLDLIKAFFLLIVLLIILSIFSAILQFAAFVQQYGTVIIGAIITIAIIWIIKEVF